MVFASMTFLWIFLPLSFGLYYLLWVCKKKIEICNCILLILSIIFYAWGEPVYIWIMLLSIIFNYFVGIILSQNKKKSFLIMGIVANLGLLFYFKYFEFLVDIINVCFHINLVCDDIHLPIGVSFFTFQAIAYIVDIYMGKCCSEKSIINVALYISFFPQLIAGPIVKYNDIGAQIHKRIHSVQKIANGIRRFCYGLSKKVIIANTLAVTVDKIALLDVEQVSGGMAWILAVFFTLQIYYDFSGYSDMAIGLGKMFGFDIDENFKYPYLSTSITEFWRRWHISLGNWFRQYVYIPLGGNRKGNLRTYINLEIVFLLTGIWHGANFNFIYWGGVYYGFFIIIERIGVERILSKMKGFSHVYTTVVFVYGWILFYFTDIDYVLAYWKRMCMPWRFVSFEYSLLELVNRSTCILFILALGGCGTIQFALRKYVKIEKYRFGKLELLYCMVLVLICFSRLAGNTYNPFIYFRF